MKIRKRIIASIMAAATIVTQLGIGDMTKAAIKRGFTADGLYMYTIDGDEVEVELLDTIYRKTTGDIDGEEMECVELPDVITIPGKIEGKAVTTIDLGILNGGSISINGEMYGKDFIKNFPKTIVYDGIVRENGKDEVNIKYYSSEVLQTSNKLSEVKEVYFTPRCEVFALGYELIKPYENVENIVYPEGMQMLETMALGSKRNIKTLSFPDSVVLFGTDSLATLSKIEKIYYNEVGTLKNFGKEWLGADINDMSVVKRTNISKAEVTADSDRIEANEEDLEKGIIPDGLKVMVKDKDVTEDVKYCYRDNNNYGNAAAIIYGVNEYCGYVEFAYSINKPYIPTATPEPTNTPGETNPPDITEEPESTLIPTYRPVPTHEPTINPNQTPVPTIAPSIKPTIEPTKIPVPTSTPALSYEAPTPTPVIQEVIKVVEKIVTGPTPTPIVKELTSVVEKEIIKEDTSKPGKAEIKRCLYVRDKINVALKKQKNVAGYEIKYGNSKRLRRGKTINSKGSRLNIKYKSKGKCYIKARAYYCKKNGARIYGSWSRVKIVKK